jgi:hypothetical protein
MKIASVALALVGALSPALASHPDASPRDMPGWTDGSRYGWPGCVVNYDDTVVVCPQSRVYLAPSITWASHARPGTYHRVTLFDKDT